MKKALDKLHTPNWLFIVLVVVLILRVPSFFEPYSYGDEMIYLSLGEAVRQGVPLYEGIHDNKPPLLYLAAAIAGNLFWFKVILAVWHLVTVFVFWKLAQALFPKKEVLQKIATVVFALLTTIPLLEGNIANAELFMVGPTILGFWIVLTQKLKPKNLVLAGVLFSIATLFKVPAAFDVPAVIFFWLITNKANKKNIKKIAKNTLYLSLGFAFPILLTFVWYYLRGAFNEYLIAAFLQNVGYLSSWRPGDVREPFLVRNGPLLLRGALVASGLAALFIEKKRLSKNFIFITSWLLLSLFAVTLSERPYPHYLIQAVPQISLLVGMLFTLNTFEQVLTIIPLTITFLVPFYFNFWRYPVLSYYTRFINLTTGKITRENYLESFGSEVPRNYKIAKFIRESTKKEDKVLVWGNSSAVYALSKRLPPIRYVADYHINDFSSEEEVMQSINQNYPEMIVVLPNSKPYPKLVSFIRQSYGLVKEIDGAEIWKLLSPNVRSLIAS